MPACNPAVSSVRSTIGSLFASRATIFLGIKLPFHFSPQEETQVAVVAPPTMSPTRVKCCLDSSSSIYHPSIFPPGYLPSKVSSPTEPYEDNDLERSNSETTILDEAAVSASKYPGTSDPDVFSTTSEHAFSISASCSIVKRYSGLGLGAPPARSRGCTPDDSGASTRWDEDNDMLRTPFTSASQQISPMASEPKRYPRKQPAGLGLGLPSSISFRATSPSTSLEPLGIGMLTSSLSISSDLCRLTSQPPSKLPPRQPQPQLRLRARTRLFSSKIPHLTVSQFSKRLLYTIPESSTSSLFQEHRRAIAKDAGSEGMVRPFGRTLF
ncbi:hypothetical protein IW261DRAFT_1492920 [Armillaria novae-zelandiae]|uniref:Uncharacterized protein n=1 Tax=Armillaria novae-zelandiae TaxID=153914 RepID=A0AA39U725_9AGAR|nr:hypothetical protein IW261DRAFT_1492920 [Armillaria novae-zelandiae]